MVRARSLGLTRVKQTMAISVLALALGPEAVCAQQSARAEPPQELPTLYGLQQEIRSAVNREATAKSFAEQAAAIRSMADLYRQILADPRYPTHDVLRRGRARLWGRLTLIQRDLQRANKRLERELGSKAKASDEPRETPASSTMTHALVAHYELLGATLGGPGKIFSHGGTPVTPLDARGGAAQLDHGRQLVELIQRTIMPQAWDVNGGPCTVVYYAPLHALVVSATEEVHEKVGGVLRGVR